MNGALTGAGAPLLGALLFLSACGGTPAEPQFPLGQCARVAVIDEGGLPIVGAEDLDIDRSGERLIVSAYDRRAAESALQARASAIPQGGLYATPIAALIAGAPTISGKPLFDRQAVAGGLRPHGLSYDERTGAIRFINRGYEKQKRHWRKSVQLMTLAATGELHAQALDCSANDLAVHEGRPLVTLDHGGCGWRAGIEDLLGLKRARLQDADGNVIAAGFGFANGVVALPDQIVVAATRERALYVIPAEDPAPKGRAIKLAGAPDNLTVTEDKRIIAAVHPSLLKIGLQRRLGIGRSGSRVIEIEPASGDQRLLFDDPKASVISAATVAIMIDGMLVIGSVADPGLAVCRNRA